MGSRIAFGVRDDRFAKYPYLVNFDVMNTYFVYIVTNRPRGVLYTGVTNDLVRRVWEHREGAVAGFSAKYNLKTLVWYEAYGDINLAIQREKRVKRWRRAWKVQLIEAQNPGWLDF